MTDLEIVDALRALTPTQFDRVLVFLEVRVSEIAPATVALDARAMDLFRLIEHDSSRRARVPQAIDAALRPVGQRRESARRHHQRRGQAAGDPVVAPQEPSVHHPMQNDAIFLSYAREDHEQVRALAAELLKSHFDVWLDHNIDPGTVFREDIERDVAQCSLFIPILSRAALARPEGRYYAEWQAAIRRKANMAPDRIFIIPVALDDIDVDTPGVSPEFRSIQWHRLAEPGQNARLIEGLRMALVLGSTAKEALP